MNIGNGSQVDSKVAEIGNVRPDDQRWQLALRIASSRQLAKATQLRDILLYLCQKVLSDPTATIREHDIGCGVLGRRADFNPNEDNIVRVQISHLRKKLDEYFASDGQAESLILTIPRGSYVPRFTARAQVLAEVDSKPAVVVTHVSEPVPVPAKRRAWLVPASLVLTAAVIFGGVLFLRRISTADSSPSSGNFIWRSIFNPASPPLIVVADSCLALLQDSLGADISLSDYIGGQYPGSLLDKVPDEALRKTLKLLSGRQYTSLGDIEISSSLIGVGQKLGASGSIHYARHMNIRDFQHGNFVLIGSRRGNPWVGLFEPQLNFAMVQDTQNHTFCFHNKQPKPGEQSDYRTVMNGTSVAESYADIALVPNLSKSGSVLILDGITMEASEAAGQLLMRQDFPSALNKILHSTSPRSLEILVRVRSLGGAASNSEIVSYRAQ